MTRDDFGLTEVVNQLARRGAGGFEWYKDSCLLRRIEVRMRARQVPTVLGYAALLADDPEEVERLLHTLSVRVTSFFRNPDTWIRLLELAGSERLGAEGGLTAWSMGCATGEEAWSLAMLLLEHARRAGRPPADHIRVIASDVDAPALAHAEAGRYPATAVAAIREVLATPGGSVVDGVFDVSAQVRAGVSFRREDLTIASPVPESCDLVACRNVLIFLGREGQRRVLGAACAALRRGGLLVLGRTESLVALPGTELVPVDATHRIYRRVL
jgi:chemotaxis methyl-accepting protein methylase